LAPVLFPEPLLVLVPVLNRMLKDVD